jgi:hypothetical protein
MDRYKPSNWASLGMAFPLQFRPGMNAARLPLPLLLVTTGCLETVVEDHGRVIAARDNTIVVAGTVDTETTGGGCGGGGPEAGPSVVFVSDDGGGTFERIEPDDDRGLVRLVEHAGKFYGLTGSVDDGSDAIDHAVLMSPDGRSWTEVLHGDGAASDLVAYDGGLAVALANGIVTSADGTTWTTHARSSIAHYRPALAWAGDRFLRTSSGLLESSLDGEDWSAEPVGDLISVSAIAPAGDARAVVVGQEASSTVVGLLDLAAPPETRELATVELATSNHPHRVVVTAAGLLDGEGNLAPITEAGIGAFGPYAPAFAAATIAGTRTVLLERAHDYAGYGTRIAISDAGGRSFRFAGELPIIRVVEE